MAKRRTRITPKIRKKPRKDTYLSSQSNSTSSDNVDESKAESSASPKPVISKTDSRKTRSSAKGASTKTRKATTRTNKNQGTSSQRIRDLTVSKSAFAKWKPVKPSTKEYVKQIIAGTQLNIVNGITSDAKKDQVQHCLENLQERITNKLECLKGPDIKLNYNQLESESKSAEELLSSVNSQLFPLETELEIQRNFLKTEEETEQQCQNNTSNQYQSIQATIPATSLDLAKLSKESLDRPIPKIPTDLDSAAKKLTGVLAEKKCKLEQVGFCRWVESLYQVQSQVNLF